MPLESLLTLVGTLQARIEAHGPALRGSEALTRYALIDPLLRELGWDTSDPMQVVPEYSTSEGWADYSLLADGQPRMMMEAKKLGEPIAGASSQAIKYCLEKGTLYFTVTNGQLWEIYETHKPVPIEKKQIVHFDILGSPAKVCLDALALWRPGVLAGQVRSAETLVAGSTEQTLGSVITASPTVPQDNAAWIPLSDLQPESRSKPAAIRFHDGRLFNVNNWTNFMVELVTQLANDGSLTEEHAPFQYKGRYLLATTYTPGGMEFTRPKQAGPFRVETNWSASDMVERAQAIVEHAGLAPAQFRVRLQD